MSQQYVKIRTTDPDGSTANITELCRTITWSGDYRSASRTLAFSPIASDRDSALPTAPTEIGGSAQFWYGSELLMDAYSLERTRDSLGSTIDVVAYDRGLYLTRNSSFLRVEVQTPETVTAALCAEYGIQAGEIAKTGVSITRNFFGVSLYKIIMTLYTLAADLTGRKYRLRFRGARLEVVEMRQTEETLLLRPGSNLLSCTTKESATSMTNSVGIYDDECRLLQVQEDSEAVALYGLMREAIKASEYDDPVSHARQLIAENGLSTTITLNATGNLKLITGNTVAIQEPVSGICGLFWIISDTHTWKSGIYQTKLSVSLEALMDSQSAGSLTTA